MMDGLSARIRIARQTAGFSQTALAEAIDVTRGAVAQWEGRGVKPRPAVLERVARVLKVRLEWLSTGDGARQKRVTLTHLDEKGQARVVDIGDKAATRRRAVARARLVAKPSTLAAILGGRLKKGDAIAVARVAGIMAAKRTSELIPLCHPIALTSVTVDIVKDGNALTVTAEAETIGQTGVEMEALTAASVAALTLYDMAKAMDRGMRIATVELMEKTGGKSGDFRRQSR